MSGDKPSATAEVSAASEGAGVLARIGLGRGNPDCCAADGGCTRVNYRVSAEAMTRDDYFFDDALQHRPAADWMEFCHVRWSGRVYR